MTRDNGIALEGKAGNAKVKNVATGQIIESPLGDMERPLQRS